MADSKTARASQVKTVKEVKVEGTEDAIKAIRDNRAAGLFIGDMSRVDKLLQAYDAAIADVKALKESAAALEQKLRDQAAEISLLTKALAKYQIEEEDSDANFEENMAACEAAVLAPSVQMKDADCEHGDQT